MIGRTSVVPGERLRGEGIAGATKRVLVSPADGWQSHVMRHFELEPGGHTPRHQHPWPHINYVIAGRGLLHLEGADVEIQPGSYAYVPADALHQFSNVGAEPFAFLCIVPVEGEG